MATDDIGRIQQRLRSFAAERDWEQFHTPKNLAMALAAEVGELLELYQWLTPEQADALTSSEDGQAQLEDELADVAIYLLRLADITGVDLAAAVDTKITRNETRFPTNLVQGRTDVPPTAGS